LEQVQQRLFASTSGQSFVIPIYLLLVHSDSDYDTISYSFQYRQYNIITVLGWEISS
jgi:hypothetical protein